MLNPKSSNYVVKKTAETLGVNEELVRDLSDFVWKEVRQAMSEMRAPRLNIEGFGVFRVKHWALEETKKEYQFQISKHNPDKLIFQRHAINAEIHQRIDEITNMQNMLAKDQEKKQKLKDAKAHKGNTGTQEANL